MKATVSFLGKIIETGLFLELIESRLETKDIGRFVTPKMAHVLDEISSEGIYQSAQDVFSNKRRESYLPVS